MGSPIEIVNTRIARASSEVPSVLFEPGTDLYGCMSDITLWDIKLIFIKYISAWWRRIYSLSLTPFSETYELRGYVVEGYQQYTPNLVVWHAECCCVMIIGWSLWYDHLFDHLSLWSLLWSSVDPKHGFVPKRSFVDETASGPHTPEMVETGKMRQGYEGRAL